MVDEGVDVVELVVVELVVVVDVEVDVEVVLVEVGGRVELEVVVVVAGPLEKDMYGSYSDSRLDTCSLDEPDLLISAKE